MWSFWIDRFILINALFIILKKKRDYNKISKILSIIMVLFSLFVIEDEITTFYKKEKFTIN